MRFAESFGRDAQRSWRETLIRELLASVRLRDIAYLRCELRAPWGVQVASGRTTFHLIVEGNCWLRINSPADAVKLSAGDLVVLPRGGTHSLADPSNTPIFDRITLPQNQSLKRAVLRLGRIGRTTRLICGSMESENAGTDPLLAVLPSWMHVKNRRGSHRAWPHTAVAQLLHQLHPLPSGAEAIVARLADVVLMEAVSEYLDRNLGAGENGWLTAVRDSHIGPALALLHTRPREPWTVASLARQVAVSRSLFAAKFARLVGEPPLHYLKRLRLTSAASILLSTDQKLAAIAAEVGYESAASFTRAFKSHLGIPPGEYRRTARADQGSHETEL
jgi:AraC-like DNA-binding protein